MLCTWDSQSYRAVYIKEEILVGRSDLTELQEDSAEEKHEDNGLGNLCGRQGFVEVWNITHITLTGYCMLLEVCIGGEIMSVDSRKFLLTLI